MSPKPFLSNGFSFFFFRGHQRSRFLLVIIKLNKSGKVIFIFFSVVNALKHRTKTKVNFKKPP